MTSEKENRERVPVTTGGKEMVKSETIKPLWPSMHPATEFEHLFDRFFNRNWPSVWPRRHMPSLDNMFEFNGQRLPNMDVIDRDAEILVRAELPGIEKKDLNISITDNLLTIKGESNSALKEEKGDFYRHEISGFSFARSMALPATVDTSKTAASLKNGILEITLPKTESSKRRSIHIE